MRCWIRDIYILEEGGVDCGSQWANSELAQTRTAKGFVLLSVFYFVLIIPINRIVTREINLVSYDLVSRDVDASRGDVALGCWFH